MSGDDPGTLLQKTAASLGGATMVVVPESMMVLVNRLPKTGEPLRSGVPEML